MIAVQCRMARAALGLGVRELANLAKVSPDTIARLERGEELRQRTVDDIRAALEGAGVEFTNGGGGPGVQLLYFVHTERGTGRLLFRRKGGVEPPGEWDGGRPAARLPKFARLNAAGYFVLEELAEADRRRAARLYPTRS